MPPTVSVNLCCYNGERYLTETLDSVCAQTYGDWELVVVDDGSTDSTARIIRRYIDAGRPIRYHRQENAGLGGARRKCLELSSGRYIAIIDQDDLWLTDKLERQVRAMDDSGAALCYGGILEINGKGETIRRRVPINADGPMFESLLHQFDIHMPTAFLRKAALDNAGLTWDRKVTASEEYCLFMQLAVDHPFVVIPDVIAKYRIHDGALTNKSISRWADEREYALALIRQNHPGIEERFRAGFREAYARARYYRARYHMFQGEKAKALDEMKRNFFVDFKYQVLYFLLLLPGGAAWDAVHKIKSKRNSFGKLI